MQQYHNLLRNIIQNGDMKKPARKGMPETISLFGEQMSFNLSDGFPLLATKKTPFKSIVAELLWIMKGLTNVKYLIKNGCNVWNDDAYRSYAEKCRSLNSLPNVDRNYFASAILASPSFGDIAGDLGDIYGKQMRDFNGVDQLLDLIEGIKDNPFGRRHIISYWNPAELHSAALPPCHAFVQFNIREMPLQHRLYWYEKEHGQAYPGDKESYFVSMVMDIEGVPKYYIDCKLYQRSADVFLGVPFNIAFYAALTHIIGMLVDAEPGRFIHSFGDAHVYDNHIPAVLELLKRPFCNFRKPEINLNGIFSRCMTKWGSLPHNLRREQLAQLIEDIEVSDISIVGYESFPAIKAELSVGV